MANLSLNDNDGSSGASDQDTLAPLPLPGATPWPMMHTFPYQPYPTHPYSSQPPPYHELTSYSYAPGSTGSQHSEGERRLAIFSHSAQIPADSVFERVILESHIQLILDACQGARLTIHPLKATDSSWKR